MDPSDDFTDIDRLLDAALELPANARVDYLREASAGDSRLFDAAQRMLEAVDASEGFLELQTGQDSDLIRPPRLGAWQPDRLLGRGGMGEVWLAHRRDGRFDQQVAIKLLPAHCQPADVDRFLTEQRTLARLEHPGIARLLDAGCAPDGRPYMVMEYIPGQDIVSHCRAFSLPLGRRLALFRQVCAAVAFAHTHLVVHRDLKPQNILVAPNDRVVLLDFGIARLLHDSSASVRAETLVRLTPHYASPEQLANEPQSTLTDVYALGLLLYELLAGRGPWHDLPGGNQLVHLQRMLAGAPAAPSMAAAGTVPGRLLRGDLDAIVSKALRPEPGARYASVLALDDDIARHLDRRPVAARSDVFGYHLRRALRRYWLAATATAMIMAGLAIALAAVISAQQQAATERDIARVEAARSKAVRDYLSHMFRDAGRHQADGQPLTAKQVLDQAASRIGNEFAQDPSTAAQVMQELGELHLYIDDYVGAEPLLRSWLAMEHQVGDATAAASVRFALSETVFRMGQTDEAQTLIDAAQRHWQGDPDRYADELLNSRMLQSQLLRRNGDLDAAIALLETAVAESQQRHGSDTFQTAALHTNLGAAYLDAGQLAAGIQMSRQALALWQRIQLGHGNDALNTLNNIAAGYFRAGDMASAEQWFARAVAVRRDAFGPSAATAALLNNYGRVLLHTGRHDQALVLAREAIAMATEFAGERSLLVLSGRLLAAEILLADNATDALDGELERLQNEAESQFGPDHLLVARIILSHSRELAIRGQWADATGKLELARNKLLALGPQGAPFLTQADDIHASIAAGSSTVHGDQAL